MKPILWITIAINMVIIILGGLFNALFSNWIIALTLSVTDTMILIFLRLNIKKEWPLFFSILFGGTAVSLLSVSGVVTLYLGYGLGIAAQILLIIQFKQDKSSLNRRLLALLVTLLVLETLGFVIVPPNPISIPLVLMMALASFLLVNLAFSFILRLSNALRIGVLANLFAYLFLGLKVIGQSFDPQSIMAILIDSPWHLGLVFLAISLVAFVYESANKEGMNHGPAPRSV